MYSMEAKRKAVELYYERDRSPAAVIRELGWPQRATLRLWVRDYEENGEAAFTDRREPKYSAAQKAAAVAYYLEHGRNNAATRRALGYPGDKAMLRRWVEELAPGELRPLRSHAAPRPVEEMAAAVADLELREGPAREVAEAHGVERSTLYHWRTRVLGEGAPVPPKEDAQDVEALEGRARELEAQVRAPELQVAVLEGAVDILKKTRAPTRWP